MADNNLQIGGATIDKTQLQAGLASTIDDIKAATDEATVGYTITTEALRQAQLDKAEVQRTAQAARGAMC